MKPKISFCIITGNEECHIDRFLNSFGPAFDELCIVRAIGNQNPDGTIDKAEAWAKENKKLYQFKEYRNEGWRESVGLDAPVKDDDPATWKHVDDFAAARNTAWNMANGEWQLWADLDDVLLDNSAKLIRKATEFPVDCWCFSYHIRTSQETNIRERLFRTGTSHWSQEMHENCHLHIDNPRIARNEQVGYSHEPLPGKERDLERNRRIMEFATRRIHSFAFELEREAYYRYKAEGGPAWAEKAIGWAEIAQVVNTLPEQRYDMFLHQADIASSKNLDASVRMCWAAIQIQPMLRDAWGDLAEYEIRRKNYAYAASIAKTMGAFTKPPETGFPRQHRYYGFNGMHLQTRTLRAAGNEAQARKIEDTYFEKFGRKFSLIHATRGRPDQAIQTRQNFFLSAKEPLGIEYIFAIDSDDQESIEKLAHYRHVIVKEPEGCVKAWNCGAADSHGAIIMQISDDWMPSVEWDRAIWDAVSQVVKAKKDKSVQESEYVLAISDGHRTDDLLTMAILTRGRYEKQGKMMFSPEYFGVYSDNEFTLRAFHDKIVIDARQLIKFDHFHPIWQNKPPQEWDETYKRQNEDKRYIEGKEIFERRNASLLGPQIPIAQS